MTIKEGGGRKGVCSEMGDGYRIVNAHGEFIYHDDGDISLRMREYTL